MIVGLIIIFIILAIIFGVLAESYDENLYFGAFISIILVILTGGYGCFHGFVNHPKTEGTHQGVITAVDLEGVYFRRYNVYLKSSGYTTQSDETIYMIYDYETELAQELKECIGKEVKLHYGHDGGYIGWNSCGTYHIKAVEIIEEEK